MKRQDRNVYDCTSLKTGVTLLERNLVCVRTDGVAAPDDEEESDPSDVVRDFLASDAGKATPTDSRNRRRLIRRSSRVIDTRLELVLFAVDTALCAAMVSFLFSAGVSFIN